MLPGKRTKKPSPSDNIGFEDTMTLHGITFTYPNAVAPTLSGVDLTVRAGTFVGIAGSTGGGKTTLVDIILGLLAPAEVHLVSDGVTLSQANLGNLAT